MKYAFKLFLLLLSANCHASIRPPHYQGYISCLPTIRAECTSARLNGYVAEKREIFHARFNLASLIKARFRGSDLSWSSFFLADLREADLRNANLSFTDFSHANLKRANLKGAYIEGIELKGAKLEGAIWINGQRCLKDSIGYCRY
jgi:uncharacterized protein YjbI with pentapeptide repeats